MNHTQPIIIIVIIIVVFVWVTTKYSVRHTYSYSYNELCYIVPALIEVLRRNASCLRLDTLTTLRCDIIIIIIIITIV